MSLRNSTCVLAALALLTVLPAAHADDPSGDRLRALTEGFEAQVTDQLTQCAAERGVAVGGETSVVTADGSTAALIPVAGVENLTRADFKDWQTVAVFTAAGPADAEAPSGTFTVQVRAALGSTNGEFQILDGAGKIVQEGDVTINEDPDAVPPVAGFEQTFNGQNPEGVSDAYHFCPWYYPYYYPYYFRYYPYYYYGCYNWYYRWWWGHFSFRYCWWPSRYCHHCCCGW